MRLLGLRGGSSRNSALGTVAMLVASAACLATAPLRMPASYSSIAHTTSTSAALQRLIFLLAYAWYLREAFSGRAGDFDRRPPAH
jgi:hypothetical protein